MKSSRNTEDIFDDLYYFTVTTKIQQSCFNCLIGKSCIAFRAMMFDKTGKIGQEGSSPIDGKDYVGNILK
jgi:hypothetical protein